MEFSRILLFYSYGESLDPTKLGGIQGIQAIVAILVLCETGHIEWMLLVERCYDLREIIRRRKMSLLV
jgi:hypothetical protein